MRTLSRAQTGQLLILVLMIEMFGIFKIKSSIFTLRSLQLSCQVFNTVIMSRNQKIKSIEGKIRM